MNYFCDTHCHLYLDEFHQDINDVIHRANVDIVKKILVPGIDLETSRQAINLSEQYTGVLYPAVGIHPNYANRASSEDIENLHQLLQNDASIRAIGEIGLDYYRTWSSPAEQNLIFKEMLKLAEEFNKPICLHVRQAGKEIFNILDPWFTNLSAQNHPLCDCPGVFHAFDGSKEIARWAIEHNFKLGIGGTLTYKKAQIIRDTVAEIGSDHLILETDAPYLAPQPHRGKRNEPAYIKFIADELSKILQEELENIAGETSCNAGILFRWLDD